MASSPTARDVQPDRPGLLLVAGFPSGGTDLFKNVLNAHTRIELTGELPFLADELDKGAVDLATRLRRSDAYGNLAPPVAGDEARGTDAAAVLISLLPRRTADPRWLGSKTPQFAEQCETLLRTLPSAKLILVVRDVRDVALSWRRKWGKSTLGCASKWSTRLAKSVDYCEANAAHRFHIVCYEELLSDPRSVCTSACNFLDLPFEERMLEHEKYVKERVDGKLNYGKAILHDNLRKWEEGFSKRTTRRIEEIAFDTMLRLGYHPIYAQVSRPLRKTEWLGSRLVDVVAIWAVGNRAASDQRFRFRWRMIKFEARKQGRQLTRALARAARTVTRVLRTRPEDVRDRKV